MKEVYKNDKGKASVIYSFYTALQQGQAQVLEEQG